MSTVKLTNEDLPVVKEVYKVLIKTIETLPEEIFNSEKFVAIVITATMNLLCSIGAGANLTKEDLLKFVGDVWDGKFGDGMLN